MIILGHAPLKNGKPSPYMLARLRKAIHLERKNNYSKIILSGGVSTYPIPEAEIMRVILENHLKPSKLMVECNSKSTIQNAIFSWELVKNLRPKSITIVTSSFHMPRTKYIFKSLYSHMNTKLLFASTPDPVDPIHKLYLHTKDYLSLIKTKIIGIK